MTDENYNPVLHQVLVGHKMHKTESYRHMGNSSYSITMFADSNRVFNYMGRTPISGHDAPNMIIADLIPDYNN